MEDKLNELTARLQKAHQDRLISVVLYGSAAGPGEYDKFSDLNVLYVLDEVTPAQLAEAAPVLKWWRAQGNPAPLLMSEREVLTSTDCFPIEFHDMQERRRVLHGKDVIAGLAVDTSFYRAQVEHELRAKLLRLRQQAAPLLDDHKRLAHLLLDSVSTFLVLARHALLLSGISTGWKKRETLQRMEQIGIDPAPFRQLLDARDEKREISGADTAGLFAAYLRQIEALISYVDRLEK